MKDYRHLNMNTSDRVERVENRRFTKGMNLLKVLLEECGTDNFNKQELKNGLGNIQMLLGPVNLGYLQEIGALDFDGKFFSINYTSPHVTKMLEYEKEIPSVRDGLLEYS